MLNTTRISLFGACALLFSACGSSSEHDETDNKDAGQQTEGVKASAGDKGGVARTTNCKGEPDGKACGEGVSRHCKKEECVDDSLNPVPNDSSERDEDQDAGCSDCEIEKDDEDKKPDPADMCAPCEKMHCRNYLAELDIVAGCLENKPDLNVTMKMQPGPDEFSKPCKEILSCSRQNRCVQEAAKGGPDACLCGSGSADACLEEKQADAPCYDNIASAAQTGDHTDVILRWSDLKYPSGYAYFMLKCDMEFCAAECLPWLNSK